MSAGQFFATRFCAFRFATFLHKITPQKTAGYMGVGAVEFIKKERFYVLFKLLQIVWILSFNLDPVCDLMVIIHPEWNEMANYKPDLSCQNKIHTNRFLSTNCARYIWMCFSLYHW